MKFVKVLPAIVVLFMVIVVVFLFQIQATVNDIKNSAIGYDKATIEQLKTNLVLLVSNLEAKLAVMDSRILTTDITIRGQIKPAVDRIEKLCLGIPLLMAPR
jgi:hypothetical protein